MVTRRDRFPIDMIEKRADVMIAILVVDRPRVIGDVAVGICAGQQEILQLLPGI